jgi:hypothetical protein
LKTTYTAFKLKKPIPDTWLSGKDEPSEVRIRIRREYGIGAVKELAEKLEIPPKNLIVFIVDGDFEVRVSPDKLNKILCYGFPLNRGH